MTELNQNIDGSDGDIPPHVLAWKRVDGLVVFTLATGQMRFKSVPVDAPMPEWLEEYIDCHKAEYYGAPRAIKVCRSCAWYPEMQELAVCPTCGKSTMIACGRFVNGVFEERLCGGL